MALPCLLGVPPLVVGLRWYLARAKDGYLRESASYSAINATLTETVEGARTVEALGLGRRADRARSTTTSPSRTPPSATRCTCAPCSSRAWSSSYLIPTVATLLLGGWLYTQGQVSLGEVTAATLYVQMLIDPVDRIVSILDELQVGAASLARLLGVAQVPDDRDGHRRASRPASSSTPSDVRFAYVEGRDVLHGVDLDVGVGRADRHGRPVRRRQVDARPAAGRHPPAAHRAR